MGEAASRSQVSSESERRGQLSGSLPIPQGVGGGVFLGNPRPASLTPSSPCPGCCLGDQLGWGGVGGQEMFPRSSQLVSAFPPP